MTKERRRILDMLAKGNITVDEAERLLRAIGEAPADPPQAPARKAAAKYLRIEVEPKPGAEGAKRERVNVRVPLQLVRAGMKLGNVMPAQAREKVAAALEEKGVRMDLNNLTSGNIEELLTALQELAIEVDGENEYVRVYCE